MFKPSILWIKIMWKLLNFLTSSIYTLINQHKREIWQQISCWMDNVCSVVNCSHAKLWNVKT
jgi:hypothetical protein